MTTTATKPRRKVVLTPGAQRPRGRGGARPKSEALEVTTFRLVRGASAADFVAANDDIDSWLARQPGFRSRRIAELDDGSIVDVLVWDTAEQGTDAAERIMTEMGHSAVHALIEQRSVVWRMAEVRKQSGELR